MSDRIELLDSGYLLFIEAWGSDERIIEAARMSTDKGFLGWGTPEEPGDERLLRYLYENKHHTPFEMAGMTIEVKAPQAQWEIRQYADSVGTFIERAFPRTWRLFEEGKNR